MKDRQAELWTLDELTRATTVALAQGYQRSQNGQVSAVPSQRTIRYYTTLGILDRPAEMRGRTAFYNHRHLLQLLAIKRLQAEGLSLVSIQERLAGLTDPKLAVLAEPNETASSMAVQPDFWNQAPTRRSAGGVERSRAKITERNYAGADDATADLSARTLQEVGLGQGVTVTLPCRQPLRDADLSAIRKAGDELLRVLQERGLCHGDN